MKDWHASTIEVRYIKLCNSLFIHVYYQWFPSGHWHFSVSNNRYEIRSDLSRADPCLVHGFLWGGSPPSNMMLKWSSPTIQYHISWRMWTVSPCEILFSLASVMWNGHSFGPCPKARTFPPPPPFPQVARGRFQRWTIVASASGVKSTSFWHLNPSCSRLLQWESTRGGPFNPSVQLIFFPTISEFTIYC